MTQVLVRHEVADYNQWRAAYDDHSAARDAAGIREINLWRNENNPNEVFVLFNAKNSAKAEAFFNSTDLQQTMKEAGVRSAPDISYLTQQ